MLRTKDYFSYHPNIHSPHMLTHNFLLSLSEAINCEISSPHLMLSSVQQQQWHTFIISWTYCFPFVLSVSLLLSHATLMLQPPSLYHCQVFRSTSVSSPLVSAVSCRHNHWGLDSMGGFISQQNTNLPLESELQRVLTRPNLHIARAAISIIFILLSMIEILISSYDWTN